MQIYAAIMTAEGGMKALLDCLNGEEPVQEYKLMIVGSKLPSFLRKVVVKVMHLIKEKRLGNLIAVGGAKTVVEYFEWSSKQVFIVK